MIITNQTSFLDRADQLPETEDWTFQSASTRELTHVYHDYPARMIPQVAGKLIDRFGKGAPYVFDPYCGSGTSLVEANLRGINAIGTDLNPLARLIAKSKTATPELAPLEKQLALFNKMLLEEKLRSIKDTKQLYGLSRLEFWFKPAVIQKLLHLREYIRNIEDEDIRLFFQVAFSETVRESSNTRKDEFKLYRYAEDKLTKFNPDVFTIMVSKLHRNIDGYKKYRAVLEKLACIPSAAIHSFNTVEGIPEKYISPESIALVVTSPPYGEWWLMVNTRASLLLG